MKKWCTTEGTTGAGLTEEGAGGKMGKYAATRAQKKVRDYTFDYGIDYNDYEQMLRMSGTPFIGGIFKARADYLAYEENLQWWEDFAKNTGIKLEDIKYPIRAGLYRGYSNPQAATIAATESVLSLYGGNKLMRWL